MQTDLFSQIAEITRPEPRIINIAPPATPVTLFTNIQQVITEIRNIGHADKMNYTQFLDLYTAVKTQTPAILTMIQKMTIAEINKYVYKHSSSDSKKEMVSRLFDSIIGSFNLSDSISYSPWGEGPKTYAEALEIQLNSQTEEHYIKYCEEKQAARDQRKKAIENPETLEEFRIFLTYRKPETMTPDQRILYDQLITDSKQGQRERQNEYKAEVKAVSVEGLQMEIKTSHHSKKNIPLWVVVMGERVDKDVFQELSTKAKKLGGYYSSYRGHGAIPGFTFESEEEANNFCGLKDGNSVNTYQQDKEESTQSRAESLEEKATRIAETANDSLNTTRKANTAKRAREAASAERQALANLEFSQTLARIAAGQVDGSVKYLSRLANITDLATLNDILSGAKYRYIQANNINSQREDTNQLNTNPAIIDHVKFPYPSVWVSNVMKDIAILEKVPGCKMAAARMYKRFKDFKEEVYIFTSRQGIEDFEKLLCTNHRGAKLYYGQVDRYKADLMKYRRVMRMQLESLPELRTALRELLVIKAGAAPCPELLKAQEIKELERKFVGKKIDGFFPTPGGVEPNGLARKVVALANIQEGNTILEPSAGLGHIADVISELYPDNELTVIEYYSPLAEALQLKGYDAINEDFLQHTGKYDRIVMNPPFENGQDIDHVLHAYSLLNEGGVMVAIMAGNKQKQDSKTIDFMEFVGNNGTWYENPAGSFLSAFRPTGVSTITVVLEK